jgi:chaperonin GroEL
VSCVAIESLRSQTRPVRSQRDKQQVATVSAHNDPAIGDLVAQAIEKVGSEGVVTVEVAKGTEITMDVVEGLQFDRGYLSPYSVVSEPKAEVAPLDAA